MRYATVCSGIEAPSVAWEPLGWEPQWFSEIERFPCQVLAHHYPHVPNLGDMTKIHDTDVFKSTPIDLLAGGTPCQSFSLAGLRKGMADPRGNLALTFLALADAKRPRWVLWENVPGVLSSWSDAQDSAEVEGVGYDNGRDIEQTNDFDTFLCGLRELGYGIAWRVLDSQYFGVAQRRRRVFVVGCLGDWRGATAVLFERHSLQGHPAPSREAGQTVAGTLTAGASRRRGAGIDPGELVAGPLTTSPYADNESHESKLIPCVFDPNQITSKTNRSQPTPNLCHTLPASETPPVAYALQAGVTRVNPDSGPQGLGISTELAYTLDTKSEAQIVAQTVAYRIAGDGSVYESQERTAALVTGTDQNANIVGVFSPGAGASAGSIAYSKHISPTLKATEGGNRSPAIHQGLAVRRLLPIECERLQGFPDGYTDIMPNGKPTADGPQYKALGNSMTTNVLLWIGRRIEQVNQIYTD